MAAIWIHGIAQFEMSELITMMVGRKIENVYNRHFNRVGKEVLRVENLAGLRFRRININIHEGEVVGFAGLVGAGRTELAKSIFGYEPIENGKVFLRGHEIDMTKFNCHKAVEEGIAMISEDRKTEGLFLDMYIADNVVQASLFEKFPNGMISQKNIKQMAEDAVKTLRIATTSVKKKVVNLSGGNQQKVVVAKWLQTKSKFFIFDEPTRGIDVGAKAEIYSIINDLAAQGAAIMVISSDMMELLGLSDRIYVMKDGEISGEVNHTESGFNQEYLLDLGIGGEGREG